MRIVQIMLGKGFGGAERSFVDICNALLAKGHEVVAICEQRGEVLDLIPRSELRTMKVLGAWDPFAIGKVKRILSEVNADIVHAHLARAAKIGGAAAAALNIPCLVKTHNYVDLKYYRDVDRLIPTTRDQHQYLRAKGVDLERLTLIPNFTALPLIESAIRPSNTPPTRLLAIGRLVHKKGFDLLLQAVAHLRKHFELHLEIVGDGPERRRLEQLTDDLEITSIVNFSGWQNDVVAAFSKADLFVLPSRDEPFGIVCLEAMASGVPIVASLSQGPREILDQQTAELVALDDSSALGCGIERLLRDPDLAYRRAQTALARCRERYTKDVVVDQYLSVYSELIAQNIKPPV